MSRRPNSSTSPLGIRFPISTIATQILKPIELSRYSMATAQLQASRRSMDESEEERNVEFEADIGGSAATTSRREQNEIVEEISKLIERAAHLGGFRRIHKKECCSLVRHMKLLLPLLEEIRELDRPISGNGVSFLSNLRNTFLSAEELLRVCNEGSKIDLAMDSEAIMVKFCQINEDLYQALDSVPFDELEISDEIQEQVELLRKQLKRSKGRTDTQDVELKMDMMAVLSKEGDQNCNGAIIKRLAEKLELNTVEDLESETIAVQNLVRERGNDSHNINQIVDLLNKFRQIAGMEVTDDILCLVKDLSSHNLEVQRKAVKKLRVLSKESSQNRVLIANNGAIPLLVQVLYYPDTEIQEHSVTSLLNLSIDETNKRVIASEGAIPAIIEVLQNGSPEARENSAAALFSLSMLDENKVTIGLTDGIPPLVELLQNGSSRGKKDAATALFNLCLTHSNKGRAIESGLVRVLWEFLKDRNSGFIDEALSILFLLLSHPEGRCEIGQLSFIETLVELIRDGTPKNKECAATVLLELASNNSSCILAALQFGVYECLVEITNAGTDRAQRKANALLQLMTKTEQI